MTLIRTFILLPTLLLIQFHLVAQEKPSKEFTESLFGFLENMEADQKKSLAVFALQRAEIDSEKYLKKLIKAMNSEDRARLLILAESGAAFKPDRNRHTGRKEVEGSSNSLNKNITSVTTDQTSHDFGVILAGSEVTHSFRITNSGVDPLEIATIKSNCGCIVPKWPREPVPPGGSITLEILFKTLALEGSQEHQVTMVANTIPKETIFTIKAKVQ